MKFHRFSGWLLLVTTALAVVCIVFAGAVVPLFIESAYNREAFAILNDLVSEPKKPRAYYFDRWDTIACRGLLDA